MALRDMTDEILMCRAVGHLWYEFHDWEMQPPAYGFRLSLRCERCTTERHDIWSVRTGELASRAYVHPDSYRDAGVKVVGRSVLRAEIARRRRAEGPNVVPLRKRGRKEA